MDVGTLTSQILSTPSPPADNAEMANPWELQPSTFHSSKATETLLAWPLRKVKFKKCLSICWWRCGESVAVFYKLELPSKFQIQLAIQENKQTGSWGHTFLKTSMEFFVYLLYPWKFETNQSSTPGNCAKLHYILWKFHDQKPRPLVST